MKKMICSLVFFAVLCLLIPVHAADNYPIFQKNATVRVQYQAQRSGTTSWTMYSTTVKDVLSESMIRNQLMKRHPGYDVRVLSASEDGKNVQVYVRCQIRRGSSSWSEMTTTLNNALTESMAENQIAARYPGAEVRILSMTFK